MNITKQMLIITILGFILSSCFGAVADTMNIEVTNGWRGNSVCTGGLKARFEAGKIVLESPLVAPRERYSPELIKLRTANIWNGVPIKLEAWCYEADNPTATGYIKIISTWHGYLTNDISIYPLVSSDRSFCLKGTIETGVPPCVDSYAPFNH